jgi:hypothetical protein
MALANKRDVAGIDLMGKSARASIVHINANENDSQ